MVILNLGAFPLTMHPERDPGGHPELYRLQSILDDSPS